jgi:hypothetical protein
MVPWGRDISFSHFCRQTFSYLKECPEKPLLRIRGSQQPFIGFRMAIMPGRFLVTFLSPRFLPNPWIYPP